MAIPLPTRSPEGGRITVMETYRLTEEAQHIPVPAGTTSRPWITSLVVHVLLVSGLLAVGTSVVPQQASRQIITPLVYTPSTLKSPPKIKAPRVLVHLVTPPIPTPEPPRPVTPPPVVAKSIPIVVPERPRVAPSIAAPAAEPVLQTELKEIAKLKMPDLPSRPAPPPAPGKTGMFENAGQNPNGHTPSARLEVQTGGFAGVTGTGGVAGKVSGSGVRTGGFGDSNGTGTGQSGGGRPGQVAEAGFGNGAVRNATSQHVDSAPTETPVEILSKPKPVYTAEARAKRLEGDVTLEVIFHARGDIQVLRVVRGLGSGLDESARAAAEQIHFRPGKKDGVPVDRTGMVLIKFEIS